MKNIRPRALILLSLILSSLVLLPGCGKDEHDPEKTAALVNGNPITRQAFEAEMERIKQRFYTKAPADDQNLESISMEVLEILIGGELLFQASQGVGITVSNAELDQEMERVQQQFPDTETFKNTFTKDDINRKMIIERFIAKQFSDPTVISDEESRKYYNENLDDFTRPEQVMASHILLKITGESSDTAKEEAKARLLEIKEQITAGESFEAMAQEHSDDVTAANGGALGYIMRGQMPDSFADAAFALAENEMSEVVETGFGLHLIKVLDKKPMKIVAFEEIEEKLKSYLKQREVQRKVDTFLKEQRQQAAVEILLPQEG